MKALWEQEVQVSVFCLAYNHEKYIRKTLDGFCEQVTEFRFEVLIHDDASTDSTPSIILEYQKKYPHIFRVITQEENQYSKGVNIIEDIIYPQLEGKYIAICEGDDYWNDRYKLQEQFNVMEKHLECSLCVHKAACCNEDGTYHERVIPESYYGIKETGIVEEEELKECYWRRGGYPFHTSSYFYRREVLDVGFKHSRDIGILRKCLVLGSCYYINEEMSVRRLFSVGNWNSRLDKEGIYGRFLLAVSDIENDKNFDEFTNYKYSDFIRSRQFFQLAEFFDSYMWEVRACFQRFDLKPKDILGQVSMGFFIKLTMKYQLLMKFPHLYKWLMSQWKKRPCIQKEIINNEKKIKQAEGYGHGSGK